VRRRRTQQDAVGRGVIAGQRVLHAIASQHDPLYVERNEMEDRARASQPEHPIRGCKPEPPKFPSLDLGPAAQNYIRQSCSTD